MAKKLLYLSCHETLEYEELSYFLEFGFEVFSAGHYLDPNQPFRISKKNLSFPVDLALLEKFKKLNPDFKPSNPVRLDSEFVNNFDVIVSCHFPENLEWNWTHLQNKLVIRRAIGLSDAGMEARFRKFPSIKTVRMSEREQLIPNYSGSDAFISGAANPKDFSSWTGSELNILTIQKWMKKSAWYTRYDIYEQVTSGFNRVLCGFDNEELPYAKSNVPLEDLKRLLSMSRVYFSTCSRPAALTYTFVEAWMSGIPVVSIGAGLGNCHHPSNGLCFEPPFLIENGVNGFVSDNVEELRSYISTLLNDYDLAKKISIAGRNKAISLFSTDIIKPKWKEFLIKIGAI